MRLLHYMFAPTQNIGDFPSHWAPLPPRPKENFPPADLSYLSSVAPRGFYENCLIGPDADDRIGWASRPIENAELVWDLKDLPGTDEKRDYQIVYHKDIQGLAEQIAEAHKATLENTPVEPGETVCRLIPSSPEGILTYIDLHWVTGGSERHRPYGPDEPLGVRFASAGEPFTATQPLVLFMPEAWKLDEVMITTFLNIDAALLPAAIKAVREVAKGANGQACTRARIWGIDKGEPIADTLIANGAELSYRNETHNMPAGVAWYGPKGTTGRMQGMEAWAWL